MTVPQLADAVTAPIWRVVGRKCTCGDDKCRRPFKHPKEFRDGTERAEDGHAVYTGRQSGIIVIDVDVKGGIDGYAQLAPWEIPRTFRVKTPSGGVHLYIRHKGFHVANKKLDSAIDVRGDEDNQYVIGPGSPGGTRDGEYLSDYVVEDNAPIADLPDDHPLIAWLKINGEKRAEGFEIEPLADDHADFSRHVELGIEACKSMRTSQADGQGGSALFAVCIRLVRGLRLPLEKAFELVLDHFNPRCTQPDGVTPYPWSDDEISHKLENARDSSNIPAGTLASVADAMRAIVREHAVVPALRHLPEPAPQGTGTAAMPRHVGRRKPRADHTYKYRAEDLATHPHADKQAYNDLVGVFARHADWDGVWQYDEFSDRIVAIDPPLSLDAETRGLTDADVADLRAYLEHQGVLAQDKDIRQAVSVAGRGHRFHPVREYLEGLPHGNPSIFNGLAARLFGDCGEHADDFLRMTLIGACRRILKPGAQVDTVLILYGPKQGEGKTQFVQTLFGRTWTKKGLPSDLGNRDARHALRAKWCIELGELASLLRTEKNAAKDFISADVDEYRQYGNGDEVVRPRQCVFIGTTNDDDFLKDATGNRRYWPISIPEGHKIPLAWVGEHRDTLWAAAMTLAKQWSELPESDCTRDTEVRHWFLPAEERALHAVREPFIELDPWHEIIVDYCTGRDWVTSFDVLGAVGVDKERRTPRELRRVQDTLRRMQCQSGVVREKKKVWLVPLDLSEAKPDAAEKIKRDLAQATAGLKS